MAIGVHAARWEEERVALRRKAVEDELNDDPLRELMAVAEAIGYQPVQARAVALRLAQAVGEREACSQVMDVMLARRPLPGPGGEETTC